MDAVPLEQVELAHNVRVLFDSANAIRIRTGIWNYEEAVIDISAEPPAVVDAVNGAFRALSRGAALDLGTIAGSATPLERANVLQLMSDLVQARLLIDPAVKQLEALTMDALLGNLRPHSVSERSVADRPRALLVSDSEYALEEGQRVAAQMGLPTRTMREEVAELVNSEDLTTRTDAYSSEVTLDALTKELEDCGPLAGLFRNPSLVMLRNLNRAVEKLGKTLIFGILDGPFLSMVGAKPPYTGCFECYELRSLARLEDHVAYHEFAATRPPAADTAAASPLLGLLANLVMSECFVESKAGTSRFSGRVLNIYLPTFEIQVQDLLRMPGCPACGHISKQKIREINFNTRVAIDKIVSGALA